MRHREQRRRWLPGIFAFTVVIVAGCGLRLVSSPPHRPQRARNVILFIGDGFGITAYTATRIWKVGATGHLATDALHHTALCSTYSYAQLVADSAASATAILTGVKTRNDVLSEGPDAEPGNPNDEHSGRDGTPIRTIAELAAEHGLATGVVTTTRVTHATPGATYAHVRHRDLENQIAAQLLTPVFGNDPPNVIFGGGRRYFLPAEAPDPEYVDQRGMRTDGRNLVSELRARGYAYVWNATQFDVIDLDRTPRLLGLFEPSDMQFERDRRADPAGEPSLAEMTDLAIRLLSRNRQGFFLMVEGGRIDHALHVNNIERALEEAAMFDEAVERAVQLTREADTLILVTADHSHGLTFNGDVHPQVGRLEGTGGTGEDLPATRRNLLGMGGVDAGGHEFPALVFATGPGGFRPLVAGPDRPALYALPVSTHAGEDVFVAARGPGAERVRGFLTNTQIFDLMRQAYGF